jgi:hypothetical protein
MAIEVTKFRAYRKNTLRGFVDLRLTTVGLTIKECTFHEKEGKTWVGYPARPYELDNKTNWNPIIVFDDDSHKSFQTQAKAAIKAHLDEQGA